MTITRTVAVQAYEGSFSARHLLCGAPISLVLGSLDALMTAELAEKTPQMKHRDRISLGGQQSEVLGAGTMQPAVKLLGATVPVGTAVPVVVARNLTTGGLSMIYPQGAPNAQGAVALILTARPVAYSFPSGILCFAHGTLIDTPRGPVAVEHLRPNQRVLTLDAGPRPVKWLLRRDLSPADLVDRPNLLPVRIPAHALGQGRPARDLYVSPQHRVLVESPRAVAHGGPQVLVAALHLVGVAGISVHLPPQGIGYVNVILTRHALLRVEGCAAESYFTGPDGLRGLDSTARDQVARLYLGRMQPARPMLRRQAARQLVTEIITAGEPLQPEGHFWHYLGEDGAVRED